MCITQVCRGLWSKGHKNFPHLCIRTPVESLHTNLRATKPLSRVWCQVLLDCARPNRSLFLLTPGTTTETRNLSSSSQTHNRENPRRPCHHHPLLKKLPTPSRPSPSRPSPSHPSPSRPSPSLPLPHPPLLLLPRQILALTKHAPPTSRLLHQPDAQGRGHFQRLLLSMTVPGNTPRVFYVRPDRPPPNSAPPCSTPSATASAHPSYLPPRPRLSRPPARRPRDVV